MSTDPTGRVSHVQDMHRGLTWKPAVRCATTASITISTALNSGDTLDGITLATGDRVLVKNQSTASQNGIYIVGATPTRAADMDQDTTTTTIPAEEIAGAVVFVISGTVNTKTIWYTTNAVGGTVGSTSIVWAQLSVSSIAASAVTVADAGGYLTATDVEAALQELAKKDIGYTAHGSTGATETFDALTGWHSATLDSATVTATFTGATSSLVAAMVLELTQDGSGGRLVTWPGSVVWPGGSAPTLSTGAGATDILSFFSRDGGSKWFGFMAGSGGGTGSGSITASGYTMSTARMLGRSTAATGAIEEITVGSGLSLSGGSLVATGSVGSLTTQNPDASVTGTATTLIFPADHLVFSGGTATFYEDPIRTLFGAPNTAYEFNTSSLTGLTAVGSPTTEDANTTILGALFYKDSTNTAAWMMRYQTAPSTPFTAITRLLGDNFNANFNEAALIVGVTNPSTGAFVTCGMSSNGGSRLFLAEKFTNRTTFSSTLATQNVNPGSSLHIYLAMVVNSTTSIDYYYSHGGYVWRKFLSANNPSLTVDSVGLGFKSENSAGAAVAFDFLRLYNSALSLPGA